MKKITLFFTLLFICSICLSAQDLQWVYKGEALSDKAVITFTEYDEAMGQMSLYLEILNNSASPRDVKVQKTEVSLAESNSIQLCIGENCYAPSQQTTGVITIQGKKTDKSFHAYRTIVNDKVASNSIIDFSIIEGNQTIATVTVHFLYSNNSTGAFLRRIVAEEGTGTWCGWCTRGIVAMKEMKQKYPETFIGIAVHGGDIMEVPAYNQGLAAQYYPSVFINRTGEQGFDSEYLEYLYTEAMKEEALASISIETAYTPGSSNEVQATIRSIFSKNYTKANFKYAIVVVENQVKGTTWDYDQYNAYSGGGSGVMGGFENLPNPIPAAQMAFDDVARAIYADFNGIPNSLPSSITAWQEVSYSYTFTLPTTIQDKKHIEIIALLINSDNGEICNAVKVEVGEKSAVGNTSINASEIKVRTADKTLFISPSTQSVNTMSIEVYKISGERIANKQLQQVNGEVSVPIVANTGVYIVRITEDNQRIHVSKIYIR